jgi:riboflavin kinase/FMN adenylyltransferase
MDTKFRITGKVIHGDGYGKKIGYPTINLDRKSFSRLKQKPAFGVYTATVELSRKIYRAGAVIGLLDKKGRPKIEAHLLGYRGNAYGKTAILILKKFIRKYKNFKTEDELKKQIGKDLKKC